MELLGMVRGVILDMDGVLWRGDKPILGLVPFFSFLSECHLPFILATNNSSKTPEQYVEKAKKFGVEIMPEQIVTSSLATVQYLKQNYPPGNKIYIIGMDGIRRAVENAGFIIADHDVSAVVVGMDFEVTYQKLKKAALLIGQGAQFIGTNDDVNYPCPEGLAPGNGALLATITAATGIKPAVFGKPHPPIFEETLALLKLPADEVVMIGDRLNTDIAGAGAVGLLSFLVLSGVSRKQDLANAVHQPDAVFQDINHLANVWRSIC